MAPLFRRKADDDRAFERIYERHVRDVYRYAAAMLGEAADAEDVTQTTFLNAYRSFQAGTRPEKPRSWLIAIAHNVCRQRFRQAQRRPREVEFDERVAEATPVEDAAAPSAQDLRRALSELPPNQRAALVMRELEGSSYAEIAAVLGISVSALETLLFRARRALREQLEERLTCEEAELAIHKQLEGRLPLSERRSLRAHLRACPECTSLAQSQRAQRRALKSLVLVPLPSGLPHWFGHQAATGAAGAAGAGGLTVAGAATGGGAASAGAGASSALLGGAAAKVAAVVAVGAIVGGGVAGTKLAVKPAVDGGSPPAAEAATAETARPPARSAAIATGFDASRLLVSNHVLGRSASQAAHRGRSAEAHSAAQTHSAAPSHREAVSGRAAASAHALTTVPPGQLKKALVQSQEPAATVARGRSHSRWSRAASGPRPRDSPSDRAATPGRSANRNPHATVKASQPSNAQSQAHSQAHGNKAASVNAMTTPARTHPTPNEHAGGKKKTTDTTGTTDTTDTTVPDPASSEPAHPGAGNSGAHPGNAHGNGR